MNSTWQWVGFLDAAEDVTQGHKKTKQRDYLPIGPYPIVDQGKDLIGGYTDDPSMLSGVELPVVVFGDHTRIIKYVDFPFGVGADGVKVLRARKGVDPRYLFHFLRTLKIRDGGYSRHFKYLRESKVPLPALEEQRRIAAVLDAAEALQVKRRKTLANLQVLIHAAFIDLFGDLRESAWPVVPFESLLLKPLRNGVSPSNSGKVVAKVLTLSAITGSAFARSAVKESTFSSELPDDKTVSADDFLICRGNGNLALVGRAKFPHSTLPSVAFPDTMIAARCDGDQVGRAFLEHIWDGSFVRRQLESLARTTNGTYKVNQTMLESIEIPMPPIDLQRRFESSVRCVSNQRAYSARSALQLDTLFASLQQRAFQGEL